MDGSVLNMIARFQKSLGTDLAVGFFADILSYRSMHLKSTWIGWHGREINMRTASPFCLCYGGRQKQV